MKVKALHTECLITIISVTLFPSNKFPRLLAEREIIANALFYQRCLGKGQAQSERKITNKYRHTPTFHHKTSKNFLPDCSLSGCFGYFCIDNVKKTTTQMFLIKLLRNWLTTFGSYLFLMGRSFSRPERMRVFMKRYVKEMSQLGVDSIGIVLLISFFIGAVICIQMKVNIQSPWMPHWVTGYVTREIMLLEFSSSIMCLILAGKVGSNIASEIGTMRVTQQIDALDVMGVNSACHLILPKIMGLVTIMPFLVIFSSTMGIVGAYATAYVGHMMSPEDLTSGMHHAFNSWFMWMSIIKSLFFAFIISSVSSYYGYTVEGGSVEVGKSSTDAVVSSSVLILFSDVFLTQLLS